MHTKSAICVLVFSTLLLQACSKKTQKPETDESYVRAIFSNLVKNDVKTFGQKHLVQRADLDALLVTLKEYTASSSNKETDRAKAKRVHDRLARMGTNKFIAGKTKSHQKRFNRIRAKAATEGVDWNKASFVKHETLPRNRFGVTGATINFYIRSGDNTYKFRIRDCIKTSQGWASFDGLSYYGKTKMPAK